jgi:thiol-disulfide isomerase/thioredoxin
MEKRDKRLLLLFILGPVLIFAGFAAYGYWTRDEAAIRAAREVRGPLALGTMAPDFTFPTLDEKKVSLPDFRGKKVVFVNMWATWCPPCIWEMPLMEKLYQTLGKEEFEMLAVSIDALGADAIKPYLKTKVKVTFPILLDTRGTIKKLYRTTGIPETFIVDKRGILVKKVIGAIDWSKPEVVEFFRTLIRMGTVPDVSRKAAPPARGESERWEPAWS